MNADGPKPIVHTFTSMVLTQTVHVFMKFNSAPHKSPPGMMYTGLMSYKLTQTMGRIFGVCFSQFLN